MVLRDILKKGADTLREAGIIEADLDAWYLLSYCMGINKSTYYMKQDEIPDMALADNYMSLVEERKTRKPLQYITGSQEFMGIDFKVNENVLIPRQDTEILVELALKFVKGKKVLDMCTGSACIATSICKLGQPFEVWASDISAKALELAKLNAESNEASVSFVQSDIWDNIDGKFDVVISNPPYITAVEMRELMPEVKEYEPELALYGGEDGLDIYKRIIADAKGHMNEGAYILMEIGCGQAGQVSELLVKYGFSEVKVEKDLAGLDRVVYGQYMEE